MLARAPRTPFALLDFTDMLDGAVPMASSLLFQDPERVIDAHHLSEVVPALAAVDRAAADGMHAVGFVSYEAAPAFDAALAIHAPGPHPLVWFGLFREATPVRVDDQRSGAELLAWECTVSADEYCTAVDAIRTAIGRGDVYQVNYTARHRAPFHGDALALYARLRAGQRGRYMAYIDRGQDCIISVSPELFFRREGDVVVTRPMKGTAARGRWLEEDDMLASALVDSLKERAENVMIVDLIRNDLGRVAVPGSVTVSSLFDVERYPTVLQMTSTVQATVQPGTTLASLFGALFPCGSVTGAPKVAATHHIASLETGPRGVYCGAIGHVAPSGKAVFNVAIRTLRIDREHGSAEYGVGGGVTWDSVPTAEYDEMRLKTTILNTEHPHFDLLETMRYEQGRYVRLERHLGRLTDSARYFGVPITRTEITDALERHAATVATGTPQRVRLLISADGSARVESRPLDAPPLSPAPVALAAQPVQRRDRFLYHKTTNRGVYDIRRRDHPDVFDVLLWNETGELTEFTTGNLVVEIDGQRWTPPRDSGLLAGTFRAEQLAAGAIRERVLRVDDFHRASAIWLINSVREWLPCTPGEIATPPAYGPAPLDPASAHGQLT